MNKLRNLAEKRIVDKRLENKIDKVKTLSYSFHVDFETVKLGQ